MSSRHIGITPRTPPLSPAHAHRPNFSLVRPPPLPPPPQTLPTSAATLSLLESKKTLQPTNLEAPNLFNLKTDRNTVQAHPPVQLGTENNQGFFSSHALTLQLGKTHQPSPTLQPLPSGEGTNPSPAFPPQQPTEEQGVQPTSLPCIPGQDVPPLPISIHGQGVTSPLPPSTQGHGVPPPPPPPFTQGHGVPPPPPPPPPCTQGHGVPPPPPPPPPPLPFMQGVGIPPPPPPPPPPVGQGVPPSPPFPSSIPAPPPVGGMGRTPVRVCRKPHVKPNLPMKNLFWKRIQLQQTTSNPKTLWKSLKEPKIDVSEFESTFSKVERKKEGNKQPFKPMNKGKQKVVHLLDGKRSQAVGILLSTLHVNLNEIKESLYKMDTSLLDYENLKSLFEIRATKEELSLIEIHLQENPDAILDRPEKFLYDVSKIICYEERLSCLISRTSVTDSLLEVSETLTNFRLVCEDLQTNKEVRSILGLVLAFGNYMNGGNMSRGQADGFELDILTKLKDVKSKDHSFTLLHYLVQVYLHMCDKNAGTLMSKFPLPEPSDLQTACQLSFDDMKEDLKGLEKKLDDCELKVAKVLRESEKKLKQPFEKVMNGFLKQSRGDLKEQSQALDGCKKKFEILLEFFYQRSVSLTTQEFFEIWSKFSVDFKVLWKKRQQLLAKQMYDKTKKRLREEKVESIAKKPISLTGLKLKLAGSSKKTSGK